MDWLLIEMKLDSLHRSLQRVSENCPDSVEKLLVDYDAQDILTLNLSRAIQLCVDIGSHFISATSLPPPETMGQVFDRLQQAKVIDALLAERMKKAVGFRNLAMHQYEAINWAIVFSIARDRLKDFDLFAKTIIQLNEQA